MPKNDCLSISKASLKATPPNNNKRDKSPMAMKRRKMNKNPNWNHNSKFSE